MFHKHPEEISLPLKAFLKDQGLVTPLLQRRLIASWSTVVGDAVAKCTGDVSIKNQTLFVRLNVPALCSDLSMRTAVLVKELNKKVGADIITGIRFL